MWEEQIQGKDVLMKSPEAEQGRSSVSRRPLILARSRHNSCHKLWMDQTTSDGPVVEVAAETWDGGDDLRRSQVLGKVLVLGPQVHSPPCYHHSPRFISDSGASSVMQQRYIHGGACP